MPLLCALHHSSSRGLQEDVGWIAKTYIATLRPRLSVTDSWVEVARLLPYTPEHSQRFDGYGTFLIGFPTKLLLSEYV